MSSAAGSIEERTDGEPLDSSTAPAIASSVTTRLRRGAPWVMTGRGLGAAGTAGTTLLLTRLLGPTAFGTFVLVQSVIVVAVRFALLGLNQAVVRLVAEEQGRGRPERARAALRSTLGLAAASTSVTALLFFFALHTCGTRISPEAGLDRLAPWVVLSLLLVSCQQLVAESLRGFHDLRTASLLAGPFGGALPNALFPAIFFMASRFSPASVALALASHSLALGCVLPFAVFELARMSGGSQAGSDGSSGPLVTTREILSLSLPMMVSDLLGVVITQGDLWLCGLTCPGAAVGLYGAARRLMILVAIPAQLATLTVLSSIPDLNVRGQLARLERLLRKSATLAALPSVAALLILMLFPSLTLTLLFGASYRAAALPLVILCGGQLLQALAGPGSQTLVLTGHHHAVVVVNTLAAVLLLGGGALGGSIFGVAGLASAGAVVLAAQAVTFVVLGRRRLGIWTHARLIPA